jgi:hypothetical protein
MLEADVDQDEQEVIELLNSEEVDAKFWSRIKKAASRAWRSGRSAARRAA